MVLLKKYGVHTLVYYEIYGDINQAIAREKQLKWWKRAWKIDLIKKENPEWKDLYKKNFLDIDSGSEAGMTKKNKRGFDPGMPRNLAKSVTVK